ncbi:MAG: metallophosphoesterase [Patescibacteria group bacterium]|jgi:hypothetical protein
MKVLLLADLHVGESRESTTHLGIIRQANSDSLNSLEKLIPLFNTKNYDAIFQMGDYIREVKDHEKNLITFANYASVIAKLTPSVINILGNHDLLAFPLEETSQLFLKRNLITNFFGVKKYDSFQIVWLDFERNQGNETILSSERLNWLEKEIDAKIPTIIFTHYSVIPQQTTGNFLFEENPSGATYSNSKEILRAFSKLNTKLVISAHSHWIGVQEVNSTHFASVPSFSEHLLISEDVEKCPSVYSELYLENSSIILKSWSGEFCLFNFELKL